MSDKLELFKVCMTKDAVSMVCDTLNSGMITQASKVEEFETLLKRYFNHPWILTLNSATSGLTLAYRLLDMDPNRDKVIATPLTCFATTTSILANGLDIIWADMDPETCMIDFEDVKRKITPETRVLCIVHWGGMAIDMNKVDDVVQYAKNIFGSELHIIEDCAHAFGTEYRLGDYTPRKLGTFGNIAVFSLQAIKHLTTGDGGLIFLPNQDMYERAKLLRWYGISRDKRSLPGKDFRLEPDIPEFGYKFHMNDINASIGIGNMTEISTITEKCYLNGLYYNQALSDLAYIKISKNQPNCHTSYWIYTIRVLFGFKDLFVKFMMSKRIVVSQVHARNDTHSCVSQYRIPLPGLDRLESEIVCIPVGWWLTQENLEYIVKTIREFFGLYTIRTLVPDRIEEYKDLIYEMNSYRENKDIDWCEEDYTRIYTLIIEDKIVSTAKLYIEKKLYNPIGHIEDVVTRSGYRGNGYGKILVKYLIDKAIWEYRCYKVVLNCSDNNIDFYRKCDMKISGVSMVSYNRKYPEK